MSITKFNINADFIAYQHITAGRLSHLSGRAYKTEGGFFALCSKGSLKTIINHTEYRIGVNKLIVVPPETFVQLLAASDDVEIHAVMFSQQLIQNAGMGKTMMDKFHVIGKHYVFPLSEVVSQLYSEMFAFLSHLYKEVGEKLSEAVLQSFLSLMLQGVSELCPEQAKLKEESGYTAMEIINRTLIMDAKTQLRTENTPVKDIALSLGFNNAAFFNKFFKRHTGVTPQMFRNSVR